MKLLIAFTFCATAMGCATTRPVPVELTAARNAYGESTASPGAGLVPAEIHKAKNSLEEAEKAWNDDAENPRVADLAYVAKRQAELASTLGVSALAVQEQAAAEKALSETLANSSVQKEEELRKAREQIANARQQTKDALSQLSSIKNSIKQEPRGLVLTLSGAVLFPSNKAELLPAAQTQLSEIAKALEKAKDQSIQIEGYTDASGSKERNEELSRHRAESVMNFLIDRGLPRGRIKAVGRGPENPIADNKTAEGRATNRRVEIVVQAQEGNTST